MFPTLASLLSDVVDYAGLFPPASLSMDQTIQNYGEYVDSPLAWMLGRLILPLGRLEEFLGKSKATFPSSGAQSPRRISCLWPQGTISQAAAVQDAIDQMQACLARANAETACWMIDSIETPSDDATEIRRLANVLTRGMRAFVEIPLSANGDDHLDAIGECPSLAAKIRTGGITADAIPAVEHVLDFLTAAAARQLPFKCTAGLHHPLPAMRPLTYEEDAPCGMMHGFWNVMLATGLLYTRSIDAEIAADILRDGSPAAFTIDQDELGWKNHRLTLAQVSHLRRQGFVSFGSCSFREPVEDLQQLGWLPPTLTRNEK